jgi:hypothetical protein
MREFDSTIFLHSGIFRIQTAILKPVSTTHQRDNERLLTAAA